MLTSIIIELLGTKMGECKLMMNMKATMQLLKKNLIFSILNHTKMHSFISCHMQFYK